MALERPALRGYALRILVVDDSPVYRAAITHLLRAGGFEDIESVVSPIEALSIMGVGVSTPMIETTVDLVLMDYDMPEMNGTEATRRLKADARLHDVPVIMITSQTDEESLKAAFDAGVTDYVSKPPSPVELLARVQSALRLKSEMDQRRAREREVLSLVEQLQQANHRLENLAALDGLTGIPNRRKLDETLDVEWRRSTRTQSSISLLMMDVDFFKRYNDTYGHLAGDECLKRIARALEGGVRRTGDFLARYGGEEFAAVLPHTDLAGACAVGQTLRAAVEALGIPHEASDTAVIVTISVGAASTTVDRRELGSLIAAADEALYQAKSQGRNQVNGIAV